MVVYYKIAGQSIGSHWLSIATLTTAFAGGYLSTGGSKKKEGGQGPPINAKDQDEEKFIQEFLKSAEEGGDTAKQREGGH